MTTVQEKIEFTFNGQKLSARKGQTIAEALLAQGYLEFRSSRTGKPRGVHCNMGVCFECRMIVQGVPNIRACVTEAANGMAVQTQHDSAIEKDHGLG